MTDTATPTPETPTPTLPTKVCPHCHVQSQTADAKCPHCGKQYKKRGFLARWFRRVVIGVVLLVVLGIAISALGGDDGSGGNDGSSGEDKVTTAKVGEEVALAGTTYKVISVDTKSSIGAGELGEAADGTFIIVKMELTNNKDESKTFDQSNAHILASDDTKYEGDESAWIFVDDNLFLKQIQPDLTTTGSLVFDVPPAKVQGSSLVIEDFWGAGDVKVDLGL